MSTWAGHVDFGLSFHVLSISEVASDSFAAEFWAWVVLYSIVLSSMMLFKRSFGLTRSLFILHVHEHDRLGFGMLTVETAVIYLFILIVPIATEKSYPVEYYLESVEEYCTAPEMIPTPKWSPTLKWSPNRPRNDPHFSSCRPRNDPQGIREWWLNMGLWIAFFVLCWNAAILSVIFILTKFQVKGNCIVFVGSLFRSSLSPVSFQ